ncbi:hypothetical protein ND00_04280 [Clostridium sp. L74]|nr:hypothetical protein ND00_04280 [Clostridium sp. L74]
MIKKEVVTILGGKFYLSIFIKKFTFNEKVYLEFKNKILWRR